MRVLLHAFALVAAAVPGGAQVTLTSCDPLGIDESGCPGPTCRCPAWWPNLVWDEYKYCRYGNPGDVCPGPFIAPALNYLTQQGYSVQTWPRIATAAGAVLQLTCGRAGLCAAGVSTGYVGLSCTPNENGSHAASVGNTVAAVAMQTRSGNPQDFKLTMDLSKLNAGVKYRLCVDLDGSSTGYMFADIGLDIELV
mmetsp:Transcript_7942/g.28976  ORF Transcript_7942/g.28976 Transcript_7942/m.28976 type:complete len:195 (-) Transcript_7942:132-716(-)